MRPTAPSRPQQVGLPPGRSQCRSRTGAPRLPAATGRDQQTSSSRAAGPEEQAQSRPPGDAGRAAEAAPGGQVQGALSLAAVAALWGTNPVCLRFAYQLEQPPSPAALAAVHSLGAALLLTALAALPGASPPAAQQAQTAAGEPLVSGSPAPQGGGTSAGSAAAAGAELGLWTFLANAATISAFALVPASRGAFLIRLTAVFTPAVARLCGEPVSRREWAACCGALLGGVLISLDAAAQSDAASPSAGFGVGELAMVGSACLWSVQTVRLGWHARGQAPAALARNQLLVLAALSGLWLAGSAAWRGSKGPPPFGSLPSAGTGWLPWLAVLWPAVGPWGVGTALQAGLPPARGRSGSPRTWHRLAQAAGVQRSWQQQRGLEDVERLEEFAAASGRTAFAPPLGPKEARFLEGLRIMVHD